MVTGTPVNYSFGYVRMADINAAGGGSLSGAEIDVIAEPKVDTVQTHLKN